MVTATTKFYQAVINLQKVFLEQQRSQQTRQGSRRFYQEKKEIILKGLTRYEYLFSDNYHRLTESGSVVTYPDLGHVEANQIYIDGLLSGQSFQETYLQISRAFDRMIQEAQFDPTQSDRLISGYEKELVQVYNDFGSGCVDLIKENFGNPADTSSQIDKFQTKLMKSVRKMLKKQVFRFWQQGIDWAEINLQQAKKKKKEADVYIPTNQAAIDALIERNLGFIKGMTEDQRKGMLGELTEGMLRGEGIDQLVKRLAPYVDAGSGKGQSRAERIARTEVMYGLNRGALSRYGQDGIEKVQWLAGPDNRCCFPKFVKVKTSRGDVRICDVCTNDMVLTRKGNKRVLNIIERPYNERFTQIITKTNILYCTSDHPIFEVFLGWVDAGKLIPGNTLQTVNNQPTQVVSIVNFKLPDPHCYPSFRRKIPILSSIFRIIVVPIVAINLYCNFRANNCEINRVSTNRSLLDKFNLHTSKGKSNLFFNACFSRIFSITSKRAIFSIFAWALSKFFAARFAFNNYWGASAFFGAIHNFCSSSGTNTKNLSASCTGSVFCISGSTFPTTNNIPGSDNSRDGKFFSTYGADLINFFRCSFRKKTRFGTVFSFRFRSVVSKFLPTYRTDFLNLPIGCIVITLARAIFCFICVCFKRGFTISANLVNHVLDLINFVKIARTMLGTNTVYNLTVDDTPEFFAGGILVHNCDTCINNDGKVFPINNAPSLPAHPNCRCTFLPYFDENAKWVDDWSDKYQGSDVENYGVYDEYGNLINSGSGTSTEVGIKGDTKDKTVIHNHPGTTRADFSIGDMKYAFTHDVKEMVVVTPAGSRCSISRPKTGWPDPESVEPAWKEVMSAHREDMKKISADMAYGKITKDEGLVKMQELLQPVFYKKLGLTEVRS